MEGQISIYVASTAEVQQGLAAPPLHVELDDRPTSAWFNVWYSVHGAASEPHTEWDLLQRVEPPSGYARAMIGDEVVGVGRVVAERGWGGVFGMATLPDARGKGVARSVLAAVAHWATSRDVHHLYLQVEPANRPALRLYGRAGFTDVARYHYRRAP